MTKLAFPRTLASLAVTSALVLCQAGTPSQADTLNQVSAPAPNQAQTSHSPYPSTMFPADRILTRRQSEHMLRTEIADLLHTLRITNADPYKINTKNNWEDDDRNPPTNGASQLTTTIGIHKYFEKGYAPIEYNDAVRLTKNSQWTAYPGSMFSYALLINTTNTVHCSIYNGWAISHPEQFHFSQQVIECQTGWFIVSAGNLKEVPFQRRNSRHYSWTRSFNQSRIWLTYPNRRRLKTLTQLVQTLHAYDFDGYYTSAYKTEFSFVFAITTAQHDIVEILKHSGWEVDYYQVPRSDLLEFRITKGLLPCRFTDAVNGERGIPRRIVIACNPTVDGVLDGLNPWFFRVILPTVLAPTFVEDLDNNESTLFQPEDLPDITFAGKHGWWFETDYDTHQALAIDRSWGGCGSLTSVCSYFVMP